MHCDVARQGTPLGPHCPKQKGTGVDSPLLWYKGKLLNTWRCKLLPRLATPPLPGQTSPRSLWQNTRGLSTCALCPGSAPAPWQPGGGSETPGWGGWGGSSSPGRAGAFPPSPPLRTATKWSGSGKKSRSWQREGAPGRGCRSCTCCISLRGRTPCCGATPSLWRRSRAPRSWSRRPTGCSEFCPGPSCPCAGCRLGRSSGSPQLDLWSFLVRKKRCVYVLSKVSERERRALVLHQVDYRWWVRIPLPQMCSKHVDTRFSRIAREMFIFTFTSSWSACGRSLKIHKLKLTGRQRRWCANRDQDEESPQSHLEGVVLFYSKSPVL